MSGARFFLLLFGVRSCQAGLRVIRYRALPNWVPASHVWGLSLLVEVFLEPGRQACSVWVDPLVIVSCYLSVKVLNTLQDLLTLFFQEV